MKLRRARAFPLVELLVVIAVVGVLASLLLPVVGAARRTAREAVSVGNLRQLAVATHAYIADNREVFPARHVLRQPHPLARRARHGFRAV